MILLLNGDLGSGKTLLTKGIAKGLAIDDMVKSPTYTIVQSYTGNIILNHFDLYRMVSEDDFYDIGGYEYLNDNAICVFEWPDIVDWSSYDRIKINIEYIDANTRKFNIEAFGDSHIAWIKQFERNIEQYYE